MHRAIILLALLVPTVALAFPPPMPPSFVSDAAAMLTGPAGQDATKLDALFAPDVALFDNDTIKARNVAELHRRRAAERLDGSSRVIAYSEGWGRNGDAGELLVIDTFDTVDRTGLPPNFLADPRMATRSILYQFGADHLIHVVRIARVDGFVMAPRDAGAAR